MKQHKTILFSNKHLNDKTIRFGLLHSVILSFFLLAWLLPAQAATNYEFSPTGPLPGDCRLDALSTNAYTCGVVTLADGDIITVGAQAVTVTFNGRFTTAAGNQINADGDANDLTLNTSAVLTLGSNTFLNANVTSSAAINVEADSRIGGNLTGTSTTGVITLKERNIVGGFIQTDEGAIDIGKGSETEGRVISTGAGIVTIGDDVKIGGSIETVAGAISLGNRSETTASIISTGAGVISIGDDVKIGGSVETVVGAISIGDRSTTTGNVTSIGNSTAAGVGVVTIGTDVIIGGSVETVVGAINIGNRSKTNSSVTSNNSSMADGAGVVTIGNNVVVGGNVESVAGAITIGDSSTTCDSVIITGAGVATIKTGVKIGGSITTAIGAINIDTDSRIGGNITPLDPVVVDIKGSWVGGNVETIDGGLTLTNSRVYGTVRTTGKGALTMDPTTGGDRDMDLESLQSPPACPSATSPLHHLEIVGSDNGVTCDANNFIIRAWADAEQNTRFTAAAITGEMTHSGDSEVTVTYPKSSIFTIDSGLSETTIQVNVTKEGTVTFDATATGATGNTTCRLGGANSCDFLASSVGFIFSNSDKATDILTQTAGNNSLIYLRAVKTDSDTAACVAALNGNSAIELGYTCNNPTTCNNNYLDITTADGTKTVKSTDEPSFVELSFDDEGYAPLTFNYRDVGNITLNASKAPSEDLLTEMRGDSNAFVVKPDHFQITLDQLSAEDPPLSATGPDSEIFTSAGTDFGVTVTAMNADNEITPNYGNENDSETIALTHTLVKPTGGVAGELDTSLSPSSPKEVNGIFYVTANWSEVGIINLIATVDGTDGANYLGASADNATTTLSNVGRFTPARFSITSTQHGAFKNAHTSYTYIGQPFTYIATTPPAFTLNALNDNALNDADAITQNYSGVWSKLTDSKITVTASTNDRKKLDSTEQAGAFMPVVYTKHLTSLDIPTDNGNGTFDFEFTDKDTFVYTRNENSQITPFKPAIDLVIVSITDSDKVTTGVINTTLTPDASNMNMVFGRLLINNIHGSELTALVMPMQIEIFNDSKTWEIHTADTTTQMADDDLKFIDKLSSAYNSKPEVVNKPALSGVLNVNLSSPGPDIDGYIDVTPELSDTGANLEWLKFDWSGTSSTFDENPTAKATFGIYKGSSFQIYIQQAFPK
jgi:hypothetical protein